MRIEPLGDSALILRDFGPLASYVLADRLNSTPFPGLIEASASYDTVGVYIEPGTDVAPLLTAVEHPGADGAMPLNHEIPVCYEMGDDLEDVSRELRLTKGDVVSLHTSQSYTCYAIGFCPGFPYLGYLPERLCGIPRRSQPRVRVPKGSVGITGNQTGVYPLERPGGWALIGRTPCTLVDIEDGYCPIKAGDKVRFKPISREEYKDLEGRRI